MAFLSDYVRLHESGVLAAVAAGDAAAQATAAKEWLLPALSTLRQFDVAVHDIVQPPEAGATPRGRRTLLDVLCEMLLQVCSPLR